jgi:DNA-binding IscR family transcriptional regulator
MGELGRGVTSEELAPLLKTNPVVLRRTLAGLREAGIVRSEKGHGGGWSLGRSLATVTLQEVYDALGTVTPFGIEHREARPSCPLEQAVNRVVSGALREAEAALMKRLRSVSVASLFQTASSRRRAS